MLTSLVRLLFPYVVFIAIQKLSSRNSETLGENVFASEVGGVKGLKVDGKAEKAFQRSLARERESCEVNFERNVYFSTLLEA